MKEWRVSVIIPTFRDGADLKACIECLRNQTYPANQIEIFCVDNTLDFEFHDCVEEISPARLLHEPRPGSYAARNRGIEEATGDIFAFTDADCRPCANWVEAGVAALSDYPKGALVAGRIEVFAQDSRHPTSAELFDIALAFPQERYVKLYYFGATANVFVARGVVERAGAFLANIASGGDSEFGRRVHAAGFPIVFSEETVVRHPARRDISAILSKTRRVVKGVFELERKKNFPKGHFWRGFLNDLRPPVQTCWNLFNNPRLGIVNGIRAAGVMVIWRYYRAAYRLKLMLERRE